MKRQGAKFIREPRDRPLEPDESAIVREDPPQ